MVSAQTNKLVTIALFMWCTCSLAAKEAGTIKPHRSKNKTLEKQLSWEDLKLKGSVKNMQSKTYIIKEGVKTLDMSDDISFNELGYVPGGIYYTDNGIIEGTIKTYYDAYGNDTLRIAYKNDGKNLVLTKSKYDINGNVLEYVSYYKGIVFDKSTFTYDEHENMTHSVCERHTDRLLTWQQACKYDERNRLTENITESQDPILGDNYSRLLVKYAKEGREVRCEYYEKNGTLRDYSVRETDAQGNEIRYTSYNANGSINTEYLQKNDQRGNETERIQKYYHEGLCETTTTYSDYEYDKTGNYIRKSSGKLVDGKKIQTGLEERLFTYYE